MADDRKPMRFEWDLFKAEINHHKHGMTFGEASTAFGDPLSVTIADPAHSDDEDRFILIGETRSHRLVVVVHADRDGLTRIISARLATTRERRHYEQR